MLVIQAESSLRRLRPLIGVLPWLMFGTLATALFAGTMAMLPWVPGMADSGAPTVVQVGAVGIGGGMLLFLVPAQIRILLRETTGLYTIETDKTALTIAYRYCGFIGQKRFPWQEVESIGLISVGLPSCDAIRIDTHKGYWFSFGFFLSDHKRRETLKVIIQHRNARNLGSQLIE